MQKHFNKSDMKNKIKLLSLAFGLSLTILAFNDKKACAEDCKRECCEKKEKTTCETGFDKACCKDKVEEVTSEVEENEQTHTCTAMCD